MMTPYSWPANPHYGNGVAIRSLLIAQPEKGKVIIAMEDMAHAFQITMAHDMAHDNACITDIHAQWIRRPLSSCVDADTHLQQLIGFPLTDDLFSISCFKDKSQHCTHMFDMLTLGIIHAKEDRPDRRYDVSIPDSNHGPVHATIAVNGESKLTLALENYDQIVAPELYAGRSIYQGFLKWAYQHLNAEHIEYCYLIQKAVFIARGQMMDVKSTIGDLASHTGPPAGSCYGTQPDRYLNSVRLDSMLFFDDDSPEQVLRFVTHRIK